MLAPRFYRRNWLHDGAVGPTNLGTARQNANRQSDIPPRTHLSDWSNDHPSIADQIRFPVPSSGEQRQLQRKIGGSVRSNRPTTAARPSNDHLGRVPHSLGLAREKTPLRESKHKR